MDITEWILQSRFYRVHTPSKVGSHKISSAPNSGYYRVDITGDITEWILQSRYHRVDITEWISQSGYYRVATTECTWEEKFLEAC